MRWRYEFGGLGDAAAALLVAVAIIALIAATVYALVQPPKVVGFLTLDDGTRCMVMQSWGTSPKDSRLSCPRAE